MKRVCAWCGKVLEEGPAEPVTHGLCPRCEARAYVDECAMTADDVRLVFWDALRLEADRLAWRVSQQSPAA